MQVQPLHGIVPAHGHTFVAITFEPLGLTTEKMELEVSVAEFNSKPVRYVLAHSLICLHCTVRCREPCLCR